VDRPLPAVTACATSMDRLLETRIEPYPKRVAGGVATARRPVQA